MPDDSLTVGRRETVTTSPTTARPFLKWAGGKRQLLPHLQRFYPPRFGRYWEPFLGSAAVFFDLRSRTATRDGVRLSDGNPDLIACYRAVRDDVELVIAHLDELAAEHRRHGARHYYDVRDNRFNPARRALQSVGRETDACDPSLAAMFIYLNRTGYNGLFRLNADGAFNVPAGRYDNPRICDPLNLRRAAKALETARIDCSSFEWVLDEACEGDFLYFDPPYSPINRTARFTAYTAGGFSGEDQKRLKQVALTLARRGCFVVLSNSTTADIEQLYCADPEMALSGLACHQVPARRTINSNPLRRGAVAEYIITNVQHSSCP